VTPASTAEYKTRLIVRRPTDASKFDGTVVVEWFNETGGVDAGPDWGYYGSEIVREGSVYVGLSAQALGINGGGALLSTGGPPNAGIKAMAPDRYGSLVHPGDQYSYDIFSQVGAALRTPGSGSALGSLTPERIIADGESQSAFFMTTYIDAIQPVSNAFDGFFVHSRAGFAAPLDGSRLTGGAGGAAAAKIRTDLDAPVLVFQTETDVGPLLGYAAATQDDTDMIRIWEAAGTAHADAFLLGALSANLGCAGRVNEGPQHYLLNAAFLALNEWVSNGTPPPKADRLQTTADNPAKVARDALGIALGGIRTPPVDVPVVVLSGDAAAGGSIICMLFGSTAPIDPATLTSKYPTQDAYVSAFEKSLDQAIKEGFVLQNDREAFLAEAKAVKLPG
jgi:hypothetical protein